MGRGVTGLERLWAGWAAVVTCSMLLVGACGPSPATLFISPDDVTITERGGKVQLLTEVRDRRGAKLEGFVVEYRSRDPNVAKVSSTGEIEAVGHGVTVIDARVEGTDLMEFVHVVVRLPEKLVVRPTTAQCNIGGTKRLEAKVLDHDGKAFPTSAFEWSSSDERIARVEKGEVVGLDEGEVVITAKAMGLEGSSKVRVTWAPGQKAMIEAERRAKARRGRRRGGGRSDGGGRNAGMDPRLRMFQ